jgi:hypothetical protein
MKRIIVVISICAVICMAGCSSNSDASMVSEAEGQTAIQTEQSAAPTEQLQGEGKANLTVTPPAATPSPTPDNSCAGK